MRGAPTFGNNVSRVRTRTGLTTVRSLCSPIRTRFRRSRSTRQTRSRRRQPTTGRLMDGRSTRAAPMGCSPRPRPSGLSQRATGITRDSRFSRNPQSAVATRSRSKSRSIGSGLRHPTHAVSCSPVCRRSTTVRPLRPRQPGTRTPRQSQRSPWKPERLCTGATGSSQRRRRTF